ncbi:MAG: NlpC/P60 family protein [Actinomycetota bacterium]|nr:NlpC/P60 family protein [Actinomycetota bacterium]
MESKNFPRIIAVLLVMALLALPAPVDASIAGGASAAQNDFNDIGDQPAEIQQAIEHSCHYGYMQGYGDGGFHPEDDASRLDCSQALVSVFGHADEEPDPSITFTDLPAEDPGYRWANLAVKYGLMDRRADGSFAPAEAAVFERLAQGVTTGMELEEVERNVDNLTGANPYYSGAMTVFMDLHLKYRYSDVWPGEGYPRGELAYTLYKLDTLDGWRPPYLESSFDEERCIPPEGSGDQLMAVSLGFERLGCPYVYGGETEKEGGFDCSGFVYNTLCIRMGYPMMRVADDQARDNRYLYVPRESLEPGDAIFFYAEEYGDPSCYIGHAGMYVGNGIFIHSTGSNAGVSFDCLDTNGYWGTHLAWGRRVVGGPYYDRFDTYLLLCNPSQEDLPVEVRYLRPSDGPETMEYTLPPHSRYTISVDNLFVYDEVSMEVSAPSPGVVAERAMYFDYQDWADGGHASLGAAETCLEGSFAEGYTADGFHTWLLLANPAEEWADVEVSYLRESEGPLVRNYSIPPTSRFTVFLNQVEGLEPGNVGISFRSTNGVEVVAERAVYFDYMEEDMGGHCSQAVTEASTELYLAEGYTGVGFDTWILLANPNRDKAEVEVTCLLPDGETVSVEKNVPAMSRLTINAEEMVDDDSFGVTITSRNGVGVVAERAMYFTYDGEKRGGHCSPAVTQAYTELYLAEGYTGGDFDTWILLANPNRDEARASICFYREDGTEITYKARLKPQSRFTLKANEVAGLDNCSFSLKVESDLPLLAERSMYFFYKDRAGGTNCPALDGRDEYRYFAEGYTGG